MTLTLSLLIGAMCYAFIYYISMPQDVQTTDLSFYVTNLDTTDTTDGKVGNLVSMVPVRSFKSGFFNAIAHKSDIDIFMEDEYYNLELELVVEETDSNFRHAQDIYVVSTFSSLKGKYVVPLSYHRTGHIRSRSSLIVLLKQLLNLLPFVNYIYSFAPVQTITIPIIDNFNNIEYQTNAIEVTI